MCGVWWASINVCCVCETSQEKANKSVLVMSRMYSWDRTITRVRAEVRFGVSNNLENILWQFTLANVLQIHQCPMKSAKEMNRNRPINTTMVLGLPTPSNSSSGFCEDVVREALASARTRVTLLGMMQTQQHFSSLPCPADPTIYIHHGVQFKL